SPAPPGPTTASPQSWVQVQLSQTWRTFLFCVVVLMAALVLSFSTGLSRAGCPQPKSIIGVRLSTAILARIFPYELEVGMPNGKGATGAGAQKPVQRGKTQRADAQRNRAKILAATPVALRKDPEASVADIAAEAGVGRMTLYGHFKTRAELIDATLVDGLDGAEAVLADVPLDGDPSEAFEALITSSWMLLERSRAVLVVAQRELRPARIREMHEKAEARMRGLLERGQREGAFRADLPVDWLLAVTPLTMNAAAEEVTAGQLDRDDAARVIVTTLHSAFAANDRA